MTERKSLHTFVGPILKSPQGYTIRIFDAGHPSILTLNYTIRRTAQQARSILLQSHNTHRVSSMELLNAIRESCTQITPDMKGEH